MSLLVAGLLVLFLDVGTDLSRCDVVFLDGDEESLVVLSFLIWDLIVGSRIGLVELDLDEAGLMSLVLLVLVGSEGSGFVGLVWFLSAVLVALISLVWFLDEGLMSLVRFLVGFEVGFFLIVMGFSPFSPSPNSRSILGLPKG